MLIPLTMLVCFSAAVLYSAAGGSMSPYASSQLIRFALFLAAALAISYLPVQLARTVAYPLYAAIVLLLLGVEIVGQVGGGSQRWLNIGPLVLQPSELMKPTIVLVLATYYHQLPAGMTGQLRALIPPALLIGIPTGLVLLQPDLGTSLAIMFGGVVVMFLAGLPGNGSRGRQGPASSPHRLPTSSSCRITSATA